MKVGKLESPVNFSDAGTFVDVADRVDMTASLVNLIHPTTKYDDLYRSGKFPTFFNQQWGGAFGGEHPNGSGKQAWFETGSISTIGESGTGSTAALTWRAQAFKTSAAITLEAAWMKLFKTGNPQKNSEPLSIQICSAIPNGSAPTIIANGTANAINGHDMSTAENWPITSNTDGEWYRFTFATNPSLSADTTYYLVWQTTGADASNYFNFMYGTTVYPFGSWYTGDDATPANWTNTPTLFFNFLIEPTAASQLLQTGGQFDSKLSFTEGNPINQSKTLTEKLSNFWDGNELTLRYTSEGALTASKTLVDAMYGFDHDRIRIYTDATPNVCVEVYDTDGSTKFTITDGTTSVSAASTHDIVLSVRGKNDGSDFVKLYVDGSAEGTQLSSQTIEFDPNFHQLGHVTWGGGFPIAPTWTDNLTMAALPSADADWAYSGDATEANSFTVQDSKLYQNASGYSSTQYGFYTKATGGLSNANGWAVIWKEQSVNNTNVIGQLSPVVDIRDGSKTVKIIMHEYYVETSGLATDHKYQIDLTDKEHVFIAEGKGSDFKLWIDGKIVIDATGLMTGASGNNAIFFGDNDDTAGENADAVWDYFKAYVTTNLPFEANDNECSEIAAWAGDKSGIAATVWNSGSPLSTKALAGIKENYVKAIPWSKRLQGITPTIATTSTSAILLTDMEMFVLGFKDLTIQAAQVVHNNSPAITGMSVFKDGVDISVGTNLYGNMNAHSSSGGHTVGLTIAEIIKSFVGLHKIELKWLVSSGTGTSFEKSRRLTVSQGE